MHITTMQRVIFGREGGEVLGILVLTRITKAAIGKKKWIFKGVWRLCISSLEE